MLIQRSQDIDALGSLTLLYPSDYSLRVEALVEARRLVGGVHIEKNSLTSRRRTPGQKQIQIN